MKWLPQVGRAIACAAMTLALTACDRQEPPPPAESSAQAVEHHVPLDGQSNFRDLGGYKTADGKTVKPGVVYRSGELHKLTDEDVERLEDLGIRTVVNFLLPEEIAAAGPDRLPAGATEVSLPIQVRKDVVIDLIEARKTGDFSNVPASLNDEIHKVLAMEAMDEYAALLRKIADPANRPLAFHCSHGIHRTGTGAAILLNLLGVPWETVREDYLLSNPCRADEVQKRLAQLKEAAAKNQSIEPDQVDMTNIEAFYILRGSYIDAAHDAIIEQYGSIEAYAREGLGLTDLEIQELKAELLE
jgi:protein-tyrosine phosphatase